MRLSDRIYLVGSGRLGFGMSSPYDCHVYAIDGGSEIALIDAGSGLDVDAIVERMRFDGLDTGKLRYVVLSHGHADHAGGAHGWRERFGVDVLAHPVTGQYVATADLKAISLADAIAAGVYPRDYQFLACPIAGALRGGDTFRVGDLTLSIHEAPGHCSGQIAVTLEHSGQRNLFSADAVFHGGRIVLQNIWDCSLHDSLETIRTLAALRPDALLPGHLTISLSGGAAELDRACKAMDRLEVPASLI
ncbi:MAG: MBL fold metallo-hydrolase [Bryobacterales bacterium]|nr:MBL fold metallo-hydrolase [Bryobacterales bacterium]